MIKLFQTLLFLLLVPGALRAQSQSKVGVNTREPSENLHINGTVRVQQLPLNGTANSIFTNSAGQSTTTRTQSFQARNMVVADEHGVLGTIPGVSNWFFMPSVTINTSTMGTALQFDLYEAFKQQFVTPKVRNVSAPAAIIPVLPAKTALNYYITDYDATVLSNVSVTDQGIMTYTVVGEPTEFSFINIVFVLK